MLRAVRKHASKTGSLSNRFTDTIICINFTCITFRIPELYLDLENPDTFTIVLCAGGALAFILIIVTCVCCRCRRGTGSETSNGNKASTDNDYAVPDVLNDGYNDQYQGPSRSYSHLDELPARHCPSETPRDYIIPLSSLSYSDFEYVDMDQTLPPPPPFLRPPSISMICPYVDMDQPPPPRDSMLTPYNEINDSYIQMMGTEVYNVQKWSKSTATPGGSQKVDMRYGHEITAWAEPSDSEMVLAESREEGLEDNTDFLESLQKVFSTKIDKNRNRKSEQSSDNDEVELTFTIRAKRKRQKPQ